MNDHEGKRATYGKEGNYTLENKRSDPSSTGKNKSNTICKVYGHVNCNITTHS